MHEFYNKLINMMQFSMRNSVWELKDGIPPNDFWISPIDKTEATSEFDKIFIH